MSIKLDNLSDWHPLSGSIVLRATDDRSRRVKVYLNCMEPTPLYLVQNGAPARFLATMPAGLETLEFFAQGEIEIGADHLDRVVYWQSTERETMWFDGDGATFTTVHERALRNEALEWVQFQAEQNQKRMEAALRAEMHQQLAAIRSEYEGTTSGVHGGAAAEHKKPKKQPASASGQGSDPLQSGADEPQPGVPAGDGDPAQGGQGGNGSADGKAAK